MGRGLRLGLVSGVAAVIASASAAHSRPGADVVYTECVGVTNWGAVGGVRGYSLATWACNIGDQNLRWGTSWNGSPVFAMNCYRLHNGRLEQLGLSFVKHACCAAANTGCGLPCNGVGGSLLGVGCRDPYSASYNGGQDLLGPRSMINACSGQIQRQAINSGDAIFERLQAPQPDLSTTNFPGATYFIEGVFVGSDDAAAGNGLNNASWKQVTVNQASFDMTPAGSMHVGESALHAWRAADPAVEVVNADVPGEGRFQVASKAVDRGNGTWRYEIAIFNLNSNVAAGGLFVPMPARGSITGAGFKDVNYHSGEIYSNLDWVTVTSASGVDWGSPQTYQQNPNANALRWGTTYNFWFDSSGPPGPGDATIELFAPHSPQSIQVRLNNLPRDVPCDLDFNDDGAVNSLDFFDFMGSFFANLPEADFNGDGIVDSQDFFDFAGGFFNGGC